MNVSDATYPAPIDAGFTHLEGPFETVRDAWRAAWPPAERLPNRLVEYGGGEGYVEGILARLVEAADEDEPSLPPHPECLCGEELDGILEEREHFARRACGWTISTRSSPGGASSAAARAGRVSASASRGRFSRCNKR